MTPDQHAWTTPDDGHPHRIGADGPAPETARSPAFGDWLLRTGLGLLVLLALSLFGWWLWHDWGFLVWLSSDRIFCL